MADIVAAIIDRLDRLERKVDLIIAKLNSKH